MRKSIKAGLFSVLICPGTGHMLLRQWTKGFFFMAASLLALGILVTYQVNRVMEIWNGLLSGDINPDYQAIEQLLRETPPADTALLLSLSFYLILACWIGAAVDAYMQGDKLDNIN